jgi:hypothetical protein
MKRQLLNASIAVILLFMPFVNFSQAFPTPYPPATPPYLGAASSFVLFTAVGAFNNNNTTGTTIVTGDVGTNVGAFNAFPPGTLIGQKHVADAVSAIAATDVLTAYTYLGGMTPNAVISTILDGQSLIPGVYSTGAASSLSASAPLTLNGAGVYILKIGGALSLGASAQVVLINGANLCDVYWHIDGAVDLGAGSVFRGTIVANGAINLYASTTLLGRGLSRAGEIKIWDTPGLTTATLDCGCGTINRWLNSVGGSWTNAANWSLGHVPMLTDELLINTGTTLTITDVSDNINIDKLHISKDQDGFGTKVTLEGSVDASVLKLHGLMPCLEIAFEVEDKCELYCNVPGKRVNIILMITANGRLDATADAADNAVFEPAIYYNCDPVTNGNTAYLDKWIDTTYLGNIVNYYKTKGLLMRAGTSQHSEFIQQNINEEKVLGWVEWRLPWKSPTFAYNNVHYTSIPIYTDLGAIPCCLNTGDVLHELNIVNNYGSAIKPVGYYVRKWDGMGQTWSTRNEPPEFVTGWYSNFESCDGELNILHTTGGAVNNPTLGHVEPGEGLEIFPTPSWPHHPSMAWYGPLNTYPTTAPLTWNLSLPTSGVGWVLLGNPFASSIKLGEITGNGDPGLGWNWPSTIDPIIYYWDATIQGYKIWNYVLHDSVNFPAGTNARANYIARNQGFFVHSSAPFVAGTFQLDNRARQFKPMMEIVKSASADITANTMRLNVTYTDQSFRMDEMVIHFIDNATTNYMRGIDAFKLFRGGNTYSDLYTVTNDNEEVAIKYYQSATKTTTVPIYFQVGPSGNYEFRANELNTFLSRTGIQLVDKKVNKTQDLKANPVYLFSSATGDDPYRFDILFTDVLNGTNNLTNHGLNVYSSGSSIFIVSDKIQDVNGNITVCDMIGRQLIQESLQGDLITRLNTNLEKGYYIVSVKTDKAVVNQKVYIN